jgi:GNAT superfamily N-acetyltransferase
MAMWRIRQAGPEDHDAVLALWREVDLGQTEEDEWKAITEGPAATLLLAEDEGTLLGTAVAAFDGWRAYIYHVAVAPPYRQRGLAKALMAEAEEHLRRKGARRVYVLVHETNTAAWPSPRPWDTSLWAISASSKNSYRPPSHLRLDRAPYASYTGRAAQSPRWPRGIGPKA